MKKILINKNLVFILLIFAFSLFASSKLFTNKFYTSHDGEGHVIRMIEFDQAFKDGQVPVRLAKRINYGLGYPYFSFNYPFIYYASFILHQLGFDFVTIFKIIMFISVLIGGVSIYFFSRYYFDDLASFISSVFYIIAPYRFLNMYVRGSIAESFALGLLPLLFLAIEHMVRKKSIRLFIVVVALLILSHNITALFAIPLSLLYFVIRTQKEKYRGSLYRQMARGLLISLLVTAFFWVPAIFENRLTKLSELTEDYRNFFPSIKEVIYSPWGFGAFKMGEVEGKMSVQIGIAHTFISIVAFVILVARVRRNKSFKKKDVFFSIFLLFSLIYFLLMFPTSMFLWDNIYYLKLVQHPWRLVGYIVFGASVGAGYTISCIKPKILKVSVSILFIALILYANRNHIRVNQYVDFQNPFLENQVYGPSTTSKDEHMPIWAPRVFEIPNQDGDIIPVTSGTSKRVVWKSNYHQFIIKLKEGAEFRDNTSYFPGWVAQVDGKETEINYKKDEFVRLRIDVPKGFHKVEFFFKDRGLRLFADIVSLVTFLVLIFLTIKKCFLKSIL